MKISHGHPYFFIKSRFLEPNVSVRNFKYVFTFSRYIYLPDQVSDYREYIEVHEDDFCLSYFEDILNSLDNEQELAFHSKIKLVSRRAKGKSYTRHVPMIDFAIPANSFNFPIHYSLIKRYMTLNNRNFALFNTGRSLHGYGQCLLSHKDWLNFMGRLLLIDKSDENTPLIDRRWIGHRIIGGYASLRWSNNSGNYLSLNYRIYD